VEELFIAFYIYFVGIITIRSLVIFLNKPVYNLYIKVVFYELNVRYSVYSLNMSKIRARLKNNRLYAILINNREKRGHFSLA